MLSPRSSTSFLTVALAGYAIVIVLLGAGVIAATSRANALTAEAIADVRAEEGEITLTERLRWRSEVIVSAGSGYLVSRDPEFLARLGEAHLEFDQEVAALEGRTLTTRGRQLLGEIRTIAQEYRRAQQIVLAEAPRSEPDVSVRRFETTLQPLRGRLAVALEDFAEHKHDVIAGVYEGLKRDRDRLSTWTYALLAVLGAASLAIGGYFSRRLARAFRKEEVALEAARRAVAARDELMGIVAHDLRNPLGAITMKAALLREGAQSERTRAQAESIENIAMRMELLIKSMLDVAVIETGHLTIEPSSCNADGVLAEATDMFATVAASKGIRLEQVVRARGLSIRGDRGRLLQVLSNLLGNALKFTPTEGTVTVSVDRDQRSARFAVSDTGRGISQEHRAHVFDRFWTRESKHEPGTGLGLFIAKGIVDAHGGRIWVDSEPGLGATFAFTVPLAQPEPDSSLGRGAPSPAATT